MERWGITARLSGIIAAGRAGRPPSQPPLNPHLGFPIQDRKLLKCATDQCIGSGRARTRHRTLLFLSSSHALARVECFSRSSLGTSRRNLRRKCVGYDFASLAHTKRDEHMEPFVFTFPSRIDKHAFFEH